MHAPPNAVVCMARILLTPRLTGNFAKLDDKQTSVDAPLLTISQLRIPRIEEDAGKVWDVSKQKDAAVPKTLDDAESTVAESKEDVGSADEECMERYWSPGDEVPPLVDVEPPSVARSHCRFSVLTVGLTRFAESLLDIVSERAVQVIAASAAGGLVLGGAVGAGVGCCCGSLFGAFVGIVPAILTFGLSVPIGAAIFGAAGFCIGAVLGAILGAVVVGLLGYTAYTGCAMARLVQRMRCMAVWALACAEVYATKAWTTVADVSRRLRTVSSQLWADPAARAVALPGILGAGCLGAGGAGAGALVGGALGGVVGVAPAIFTFGVSILVFAILGAVIGLLVGMAIGGIAGFVGAGAIGYGAYHRCEIVDGAWSRARGCARQLAGVAEDATKVVRERSARPSVEAVD